MGGRWGSIIIIGWIQLARCLQVFFIWFDTSRRPTALLPAGSSVSPFASAALHFPWASHKCWWQSAALSWQHKVRCQHRLWACSDGWACLPGSTATNLQLYVVMQDKIRTFLSYFSCKFKGCVIFFLCSISVSMEGAIYKNWLWNGPQVGSRSFVIYPQIFNSI